MKASLRSMVLPLLVLAPIASAAPRPYTQPEQEMVRKTAEAAEARTGWRKMEKFEVSANDIKRAGRNFDWWNPLWHDRSYAASTRHGDIIAPPFFLSTLAGAGLDMVVVPGVGDWGGTNDGGQWNLYRPLKPGDSVRVWQERPAVTDVTVGDGPRTFHIDTTWVFINQEGERVASFTSFLTNRFSKGGGAGAGAAGGPPGGAPPAGAPPAGAPPQGGGGPGGMGNRERTQYSADDWKKIDALAHGEQLRGAQARYWEDVKVGDQPAPVIAEPTTVLDMIRQGGDIIMSIPPLREMPRELGKELTQDSYGVYHNLVEQHFTGLNGGSGIHFMAFGEGQMGRFVTNFMGDDGWMKRFDAGHRTEAERMSLSATLRGKPRGPGGHGIAGDAVVARGEVVRKYEQGDEHLVDLVVWTENLAGQAWQDALVTVRLPSRTQQEAWR